MRSRALDAMVGGLRTLRAVRLVRAFRVSKLLGVMGRTIAESRHALYTLVFFLLIAMVLFSSAVFYAESWYCPDFSPTPQGEAAWLEYERECRSLGASTTHMLCCTYKCNPHYAGSLR